MIFGGSHEKTMTLNPPCQPHCKVAGWGCSEAVGHPVGDGRAIREPGFHSVGVYVVAEGKQFLRVIMVEILISFHLNSSFNDFEIWFSTRWGLFFLSPKSPNRTTLHQPIGQSRHFFLGQNALGHTLGALLFCGKLLIIILLLFILWQSPDKR